MTLRISQYAVVCGLSLLALPGVVTAQTPRYQSPITAPSAPAKANLPTATAITPNGEVVENVAVRVNDQIISRSDVERSEQQLAQELQQSNASPAETAEREKNMLRDMIDQQLLLSRGKELGINADTEVIRRLDEIRKQNKLDTMEDLEKAARSQGVSFEDFKANIRNSVITQQVVRDEVGRRLQSSPSAEQAYYEAHKQEMVQPEQVRLSEILIPTAADANEAAVAQAQTKANGVEDKLKGGAKFDDVAKSTSGGPTASQGGDLGQFKRGALAKVLEDQTFSLKAGEFTAPIRTRQGFVILKVTEHVESGVPSLKDVEPQIQEAMYMEQMQPALRAYLTKLREDAFIDPAPGYVDSGASSKQTKPVFTAYTAPVLKKKRVVQKQRFDRGGRFSTATKDQPAFTAGPPAATGAAAATTGATAAATGATAATLGSTATGAATGANPAVATPTATPVTTTGGQMAKITRRKKVKREKVRYGQAPRNSLPGNDQAGMAADNGLGADHEGPIKTAEVAPGTAIAPVIPTESTSDVNPLTPTAPVLKKTRYADRAQAVKVEKVAKKTAKTKEKAIQTAAPLTADEKAAAQTQAAPLGLSGDTAKKVKKVKVKGAPKERLQDQAPKPPPPPPIETPSKGSDRGTVYEGTAGPAKPAAPSSDQTTLPAVSAPSSATPPQGTTQPATPGVPIGGPPQQ
ncbi:peptidylprolyl isomerase [Granulicella arctica]|uniref:peptidylprolyl isomerase n=1 Tax=Granulicella arctica TaxID=940613 RepID=UPI0021E0E84A|nr:peptidylprolyl isomerase [Granulicella arctica]